MALAWGVSTSVTSDLNSSIMASPTSPPFSLASDFCSDPRWSMAAAAMTPRSFETLLSPASFPAVIFINSSDEHVKSSNCKPLHPASDQNGFLCVLRELCGQKLLPPSSQRKPRLFRVPIQNRNPEQRLGLLRSFHLVSL